MVLGLVSVLLLPALVLVHADITDRGSRVLLRVIFKE
jgi:hypothetical protein